MKKLKVSLICLPEVEAGTLYGAGDAFFASNGLWQALTGLSAKQNCAFLPETVGLQKGQITSCFGFPLVAQKGFDEVRETDIIYIPALLVMDLEAFARRSAKAAEWITARYHAGAIVASACTGTLLLAQTGLLEGTTATSHWAVAGMMKAHYPNVQLAQDRILSFSGPGHRLITAGGASSWQDLCLYLIMRFAGLQTAREVSRLFLFQWHRDGQTPYVALQRNTQHNDAIVGSAQLWLAENYSSAGAVARCAGMSGLSARTFNRRFRAATGLSPSEYLQYLRIEEAKQLLETTPSPIEGIAESVGYLDEASFRRLFKRIVGMTPATYRRKFLFPSRNHLEARGGAG